MGQRKWNVKLAFNDSDCLLCDNYRMFPGLSLVDCSLIFLYPRPTGGHIGIFGFRTLTLVWLWISTWNFSSTLLVYIGRSLSIFSDVTFKMAAWWPYWIFVCRRHGFRSVTQICFGISISNFMCMLFLAIGRSLSIFSDVTFKMAAWRPYWIFWFPDSNFSLALNINLKLQ